MCPFGEQLLRPGALALQGMRARCWCMAPNGVEVEGRCHGAISAGPVSFPPGAHVGVRRPLGLTMPSMNLSPPLESRHDPRMDGMAPSFGAGPASPALGPPCFGVGPMIGGAGPRGRRAPGGRSTRDARSKPRRHRGLGGPGKVGPLSASGTKDGYSGLDQGLCHLGPGIAAEGLEGAAGRTSVEAHHIHGGLEAGHAEAGGYGRVGR